MNTKLNTTELNTFFIAAAKNENKNFLSMKIFRRPTTLFYFSCLNAYNYTKLGGNINYAFQDDILVDLSDFSTPNMKFSTGHSSENTSQWDNNSTPIQSNNHSNSTNNNQLTNNEAPSKENNDNLDKNNVLPPIKHYDPDKLTRIGDFIAYLSQCIHLLVRNSDKAIQHCKEHFKNQRAVFVIDNNEILKWKVQGNSFLNMLGIIDKNKLNEYEEITKRHEMIFHIIYMIHILMKADIKTIDVYFTHSIFVNSHSKKHYFNINLENKDDIFKLYEYLAETGADKINLIESLKIQDDPCIFFIDKNFCMKDLTDIYADLNNFTKFMNERFRNKRPRNPSAVKKKLSLFRRLFRRKKRNTTENQISFVCCNDDRDYSEVLKRYLSVVENAKFIDSLTSQLRSKRITTNQVLYEEIADYIYRIIPGSNQ